MSLWAHYKGKKLYSIKIGTKSEHTGAHGMLGSGLSTSTDKRQKSDLKNIISYILLVKF